MALTVPGPAFAPGFDATLIDADDWTLTSAAQSGSAAAWSMLRGPFEGTPQFACTAKTTDATAASSCMDLTVLGLTFPAKSFRTIFFRSTAVNGADTWRQDWEQEVWGNDGTTPKLMGSPRLISARGQINGTVVQYGVCHAVANFDSSDTAIVTVVGTSDATGSTAGSSIGSISTNTATLTHPIARNNSTTNTVGRRVLGVNASADVATATEQILATVFPVNATTMSIFTADTATPTADGFDDDGRLEVSFFILPPPSIALVMSSNAVQVHVGYDATDNVYHRVEVWAKRADIHLLAID
jgi:hypothetical protein